MKALTSSEIEVVCDGEVVVPALRLPMDFLKPLWIFFERFGAPRTIFWNIANTRGQEISARLREWRFPATRPKSLG